VDGPEGLTLGDGEVVGVEVADVEVADAEVDDAEAAGVAALTPPRAGAPLGSPGMLYSASHADPDGSVDSVAGETPWLDHLAW
jgi:hypothetical protein